MGIHWQDYEAFDWVRSRQLPMTGDERQSITELAADLLQLSPSDRSSPWGQASPPGRFAATVIRVAPEVQHCFQEKASAAQVQALGVKVFKTTADARREAQRVVPFHCGELSQLPGLPSAHVQKSLHAGLRRDGQGQERAFVLQEWVVGESLEDLIRRRWPVEPATGKVIRSILEQLLGGLILPLWEKGALWWDVRDANFCYHRQAGRLTMIDVDSLAAYADEVLRTPEVWEKRDRGRSTALARLRQMSIRLVLAQGMAGKKKVQASCTRAWASQLEPALLRLGKEPEAAGLARAALQGFLQHLEESHCFLP